VAEISGIRIFEDVTERMKIEEALRESENRFRDLASLLPSIVYECDLEGKVVFASRVAHEQLGYTQEDMDKGLNVIDVIAPEDRQRAKKNIQRILQDQGTGPNEYIGLTKDGSRFPVLVYSSPIIKEGKPAGLRGIIIDISDRKKMEEVLVRSQKLESLGVLAGGIAHDFNNMLVGVLGNISLAREEIDLDSPARVFLRQAEFAADKAKGLTHQLLTFSKGGEPIVESVDMAVLVRNAAEFALRGSRVAGQFNMAPDLWYGEVDSNQISQVIQNMVLNSIQCMPGGGEIQVSCVNCEAENGNCLSVSEGNFVKITITDQGPGMTEEVCRKIFDPYFTTKDGSSGLGLAVVHSIVRRHKGTITVDSAPSGGATFTLFLPAVSHGVKCEKVVVDHPPATCKVLVMDDDGIVLQVASAMLARLGYDVGLAVNGNEALEHCQTAMDEGQPYNVVILDLTIPGGPGGVEVLKKLRDLDPSIKAIVSSGYSNDPVMEDHEKYGFQGVVPKPYQLDGLDVTIKQVMARPFEG